MRRINPSYFHILTLVAAALAGSPAAARDIPAFDPASCARPAYPKPALRLEQEGTVILEYRIGADGKVLESRIAKSSGFPMLDTATQQALERCTCRSTQTLPGAA